MLALFKLVNAMSDTYDVDEEYSGPGIALQRWVRSQDSRSGSGHVKQMFELMQKKGEFGMKPIFHQSKDTVLMVHKPLTHCTLLEQDYWLNTSSLAAVVD